MKQSPRVADTGSTRARLVDLLRREPRTVEELAVAVGISRNAVRAQLAALERDGVAHRVGQRRGPRKPSHAYAITAAAEPLLSRLYAPVARQLVRELAERMTGDELHQLFRAVGARLAAEHPHPDGDIVERVRAASALLNAAGAITEVTADDHSVVLQGYACPLSAMTTVRPEVCGAVEALLEALLGQTVTERCERSRTAPRCRFSVPAVK